MNDRCPDCGEIPSMMVKHDCVRNERDRYKAALEQIAFGVVVETDDYQEMAKEALRATEIKRSEPPCTCGGPVIPAPPCPLHTSGIRG